MGKSKILVAWMVLGAVTLLNSSFANQKVTIYHNTQGPQGYILITVSKNALQGHAKHGDLYFSSLCPVDGAEWACR